MDLQAGCEGGFVEDIMSHHKYHTITAHIVAELARRGPLLPFDTSVSPAAWLCSRGENHVVV